MMNEGPAPPGRNDLTGRQLGNYRVLRRLGRGGMADVYLAEQITLGRLVAMKVLREDLAADLGYVQRFELEAKAAAALEHENIVRIYEVGQDQGLHYIAQEYIQGWNLREYMVRRGPPPVPMAISVLRQVALALHQAARKGIVHRDIKPENILLTQEGKVKVADFGLARFPLATSTQLTQTGMALGTPLYMSPEQIEGRPVDHRSDLYSLGVTAYYMLAGVPPFRGDNALSVAVQHVKARPERLENLVPDLPPALCRIVHRLLEKDPAQRYQSAAELLADLNRFQLPEQPSSPEEVALEPSQVQVQGPVPQELTAQLGHLMRTQSLELQRRGWKSWLGMGLAVLGAVVWGGLGAYQTRPRLPLHPGNASQQVVRLPSAEAQLLYAMQLADSAPHWQAVLQYYPENQLCVLKAKRELALLYLRHRDLDLALRLFNEFANDREAAVSSRLFGLGGQTVVYTLRGEYEKAQLKLEQFQQLAQQNPIAARQMDLRMRSLLRRAVRRIQKALPQQARDRFQQLLEELEGAEELPPSAGAPPS